MAKGHLEEVKIIVQEHCDMVFEDEIKLDCSSTLGWKCLYNGKQYGNYVRFTKPTLTVAEVVETTNFLLQQMVVLLSAKKGAKLVKKNDICLKGKCGSCRYYKQVDYNSEVSFWLAQIAKEMGVEL